jgi:hypothetical protein
MAIRYLSGINVDSNTLFVDSTNNRVGIGTASPTVTFEISGRGLITSSGSSDTFAVTHSSGSGIAVNITKGGNGEGLYVNKTSGNGNAVTIVGTLNATTLVKSGGTSSQYLMADGSVSTLTNPVTGTGTTNYVPKWTSGSAIGNSQIFDNGTNVTISGTNGGSKLSVYSGAGDTGRVFEAYYGSGANMPLNVGINRSSGNAWIGWNAYQSTGDTQVYQLANRAARITSYGDFVFQVAGDGTANAAISWTEAMRIGNNGNVLIGTSTDSGYKLNVVGEVSFSPNTAGKNTFTFTTNAANDARLLLKSDTTTKVDIQANGTTYFDGGNVAIGNVNTSDVSERLNVTGNGIAVEATDGGIRTLIGTFGGTDSIVGTYTNNNLQIRTNNNSRIFVTNTGDVGIGTTSPGFKLNVVGGNGNQLGLDNTGERFTQLSFLENGSQNSAIWLDGTDNMFDIYANTSHGIRLKSGGDNTRLTVTSGGNVLIGTTTDAGYKLYVSGTGTSTNLAVVGNIKAGGTGTSGGEIIASGALGNGNFVSLRHDDTNAYITVTRTVYDGHLILQPYGNVGIGTASPAAKLEVSGSEIRLTSGGAYGSIVAYNTGATGGTGFLGYQNGVGNAYFGVAGWYLGNTDTGIIIATDSSSRPIRFYTNFEQMRIAGNGNVLIGTTTDTGYKLFVSGTGKVASGNISISFLENASWGSNVIKTDMSASAIAHIIGQDNSTNNSATIRFYYAGAASNDNYVGLGFYGNDDLLRVLPTGKVRLTQYGSGTITGTPAYNLGVDSSGNVIELPGGVVDGSGTANYVTKWQDANTVTDSSITDDGTTVTATSTNFVSQSSLGTAYTSFTSSGGTANFDTITRQNACIYQVMIVANPNSAGSGSYADFYYGKVFVGTGFSGSAVTDYIYFHQESPMPRGLYGSGGPDLTVTAVMVVGGSEVNSVATGGTYTIRLKISGYVVAGSNTTIRLQRLM